jgi:hypothetical protein
MQSKNPALDRLFAFGIDPTGGATLPNDEARDWPREPEIRRYNEYIRNAVDTCLDRVSDKDPDGHLYWVAIEHRLMHAETLAYMLHCLPFSKKKAQFAHEISESRAISPKVVTPEGTATLGMDRNSDSFG